ncbi:GlxA family transcriptional regulator [Metapseudomonas resinovorans]|uniref:Putative AraC family transcriptional regulator n=1 Tax=Metapseudomonas resinovorans NBRC 106553 TaxID=1245471 RepID=S6ALX7_METRE|nr:GlxA family transcriptional regulator [Pseudomonas resinovorans]BAN49830.1 putative AraC family transcriptional regulator [Pseudomonas resinovorans NBRC 106553]
MTTQLEIGLLLYPGAQLAAAHGLSDLFMVANRMAAERAGADLPVLRVRHWAAGEDGEIGCTLDSHPGTDSRPTVVVLPPCLGSLPSSEALQPFADWLHRQHATGATLSSVCAGAYLLAQTGLLKGRVLTTHWSLAKDLGERFPDLRVDADKLVVDDGDIITAGGVMAWTDLGLALVDRLLGPTIAAETARFLVLDLTRHSQQYFRSFTPTLTHGDASVLKVQHWLQREDARNVDLATMAAQAGLGERTFLRRFQQATGMRPTEYCQQLRAAKARELLELTNRSVDQIAWEVGYQDPAAFRKVFNKMVGLSPTDYRRRFGQRSAERG